VPTTVEKVLFLKQVDLFRALPGEELAQLAQIAQEETVSAGGRVFSEGDTGDSLYIVVEGRVRVHKGDKLLVEMSERECFGEMSVLDSESRSASVTAVMESLLLKIGRDDFKEILNERPDIALGIMKVLSRRLRETNTRAK
jgi:CRP-like cAMP-binding protein